MRMILLAFLAVFLPVSQVMAQGALVPMPAPKLLTVSPISNENLLDVYKRQIAYREASLEFRRILIQRQESYAAASRQARQEYEVALEAMNATRDDVRGETR